MKVAEPGGAARDAAAGAPVQPVRLPVIVHRWEHMTFLHWRYDPAAIQPHLPDGLEVERFGGDAWVSLTPFQLTVRPPGLPRIPLLSTFPETNLRTYVRTRNGATGIWFLAVEAQRLPAVLAARAAWGLPYNWSSMTFERDGDVVRYTGERRWPRAAGAGYAIRVEAGAPMPRGRIRPLDDWLVSRFRLFGTLAGKLLRIQAEHEPWPLRRVKLLELRQDLLTRLGLPAPAEAPLAHFSDGVQVKTGLPLPA